MNNKERRQIALGAVRATLRKQGRDPRNESAATAHEVLDEIAAQDRSLVASDWYLNATQQQLNLFYNDWGVFKKTGRVC